MNSPHEAHIPRPRIVSEKLFYSQENIHLKKLTLEISGKNFDRVFVDYPPAVAAIPVLDNGNIILVRQYRLGADGDLWEIPAGKLDPGEKQEEGLLRELQEEIGYTAEKLQLVHSYYPAASFCNEVMHIYVARGLKLSSLPADEDEHIEKSEFTPFALKEMLAAGEIVDAKTLIALNWYLASESLSS